MTRPLREAAVVITGASSGIGRCSAIKFAGRGAHLTLAARGAEALAQTADICTGLGAQVQTVVVDVRDEDQVTELAHRAVQRFGRIDVWVNNAGVIAYGAFEEVPTDVFRAVIETNLMGQVHGSRAALREFRRHDRGVLINVASVWARVTTPDVSAYVTSKFALRAFSECLRQELRDAPDIHVATMLPQAVDTPIFANAANYAGRRARPIPPLVTADEVADGILACAQDPLPEVTYHRTGRLAELAHSLLPGLYQRAFPPAFSAGNYARSTVPLTAGNVLEPAGSHEISGGWRSGHRRELARAALAAAGGGLRGLFGGFGR